LNQIVALVKTNRKATGFVTNFGITEYAITHVELYDELMKEANLDCIHSVIVASNFQYMAITDSKFAEKEKEKYLLALGDNNAVVILSNVQPSLQV
jgi:hypothetical protein